MKKTFLKCLAVMLLLLTALAVTSCSRWDDPYDEYNDDGKSISIKYLANGGFINSGADAVIDVFDEDSSVIKLIAPESAERGKSQVTLSHRLDYRFAGWYVAVEKKDASGNVIDADGNPVSESGKAPAYEAGRRWSFETDTVTVDTTKEHSAREPVLTLMAMWIPKFDFEFYAKDGSGAWELIHTEKAITLELPKWSNGKINMMGFPSYPDADMTFKGAYTDPEMTNAITGATISGKIDYEHGVAAESTVKIYTEWYEGNWFMIENASQLYANARANGNYMLLSDIDMAGELWPTVFSQNTFRGKFYGNGHAIKNVSANQQGQYRKSSYGLFGAIGQTAEFKDVAFENISYTVEGALNEASFGLFAGNVAEGATFENVSITGGKLLIDPVLFTEFIAQYSSGAFDIRLLYGYGTADITTESVTCEHKAENTEVTIAVNPDGKVSFTFPASE